MATLAAAMICDVMISWPRKRGPRHPSRPVVRLDPFQARSRLKDSPGGVAQLVRVPDS